MEHPNTLCFPWKFPETQSAGDPPFSFFESAFVVNNTSPMVPFERSPVAVAHTHTPHRTARPPAAPPRRERDEEMGQQRRRHKHVWEGSVVRHAARRFSLSGTAPPF